MTRPTPPAAPLVERAPTVGAYDRRAGARDGAPAAPPLPFDPLTVPLDPGIALVEASAGTGKTFCITLAVLRLLLDRDADGAYRVRDLGSILVVTFTIAATDELITRVRSTLRDAVDVFAGTVAERTERTAPLFDLRDRYGTGELARLREALASLDRLSIFTIHGFCKRVLEESALESGTPYGAGFLEDDALLAERAAQDWWRRTVYEEPRLAAIAVHEEWKHDAFLEDWRRWRRHPGTRLDPDESLPRALDALDRALAGLAAAWDADRAAAFLDAQAWRTAAPLAAAAARRRVVAAGTAAAGGDVAGACALVAHCTTAAIRDEKKGIKLSPKDRFAQVEHEPFVRAVDALVDAFARLRGALRVSCIGTVDQEFHAEKRRRHLLGFDDLLSRLQAALRREGPDGTLARAIRARYDAALIDEFQDTDAYQFDIFSTAFAGRPLFLIGDPKQAIYGFRGADIFAYMGARRAVDREYTLGRNWRSTPAMVAAVNALFGRAPSAFLYESIPFAPATAAREPSDPIAGDGRGALHWWFVPPEASAKGGAKLVGKGVAEERLHAALAREVVRLLRPAEAGGGALRPGQLAVLVRTGYEGAAVQRALRAVRVPCIVAGMGDILAAAEMHELESVLRAVLTPQDAPAVRAALATTLWGLDAPAIHRLTLADAERAWEAVVERLARARESWARHGFVHMVQELIGDLGALERLLAADDGERRVTNLRHAVELLHGVASEERLSPEALLLWIGAARAAGSEDAERVELRLESDADAVQIVTIHKSKGLEYDVVFCPGLWSARRDADDAAVLVHEDDGSMVLDHGSARRGERAALANAERLAEELRLAYVALTRARVRCYVGWGAVENAKSRVGAPESALGYLLRDGHAAGAPEEVAAAVAAGMRDPQFAWDDAIGRLAADVGSSDAACVMSLEVLDDVGEPAEPWHDASAMAAAAPRWRELPPVERRLETWRVSSFTSLTAASAERHVEDARDVSDASADTAPAARVEPIGAAESAPAADEFLDFPAGREPGIALHELFEKAGFDADEPALQALGADVLVRRRLAADAHDPRVRATARMAARVLGAPLPGAGFALRDVPRRRTLREWGFHLPLGDVDRHTLVDLFEAHGGDVARAYAPALRALAPRRTWGFLTGVVDLALEHDGRWHVVDWKSNHLGRDPSCYEGEALRAEMFDSHYVLQYHLYLTALHRFLRRRVPGYAYETHVGGAWYAFLRGIDGSARGWWHDRPPAALVHALDALMTAGIPDGATP